MFLNLACKTAEIAPSLASAAMTCRILYDTKQFHDSIVFGRLETCIRGICLEHDWCSKGFGGCHVFHSDRV